MIPRKCRRVQRHLALHAGNDLGPRGERLVREHVGRCLTCARELEQWRSGRDVLGALAGGHADVESVWPGLERALEADGGRTRRTGVAKRAAIGLPLAAAAGFALWWGTGVDDFEVKRPAGYLRPVASATEVDQPRVIHRPVLVPVLWRTEDRSLRPVPSEDLTELAGSSLRAGTDE